jgi:hypothetical protein
MDISDIVYIKIADFIIKITFKESFFPQVKNYLKTIFRYL